MKITSIHNQKILILRQLYKNNERKNSDVFLAEGKKEVLRGINSGFKVIAVYFSSEILNHKEFAEIISCLKKETEIFDIDKKVYEKIAYRTDTEGIIAMFAKKQFSFEQIVVGDKDIFLVLEAIEKPGNLGAVLRTADAAGVKAIILTEAKVDQYHPNVIRSSLGAAFTMPVILSSNEKAKAWFDENNVNIYSAALPAYKSLYEIAMNQKTAFVFGSESLGLTDFWLNNSQENFTIPMTGIVDSLNISVSVAITLYEAVRQQLKSH
jgi:RNA methyltransferase, TrmH family